MNRNDLWIKNNNIEENYENIKMIFQSFNLEENKDFWLDNSSIKFKKKWKNYDRIYKVVVDKKICSLLIYLRDVKYTDDDKETYHLFRKKDGNPYLFNGFDPWVACVKFLIR